MLAIGGQPLNKGFARCVGKLAPMVIIAYGGTEFIFGSYGVLSKPEQFQENYCGTVHNIPGLELKIIDQDGEIVPINTRGEICIRSPAMFKEYYNDPVKTAEVKSHDGWYKTDDLGKLDENEMLYVVGRKSSMIISGGMNVAPDIIERVLESHNSVACAVIVPVPDQTYYQVLCACVLQNPGTDVTEQELRGYLDEYINDKPGSFTVIPMYYMIANQFPQLYSGKISRKALAELALEEFGK